MIMRNRLIKSGAYIILILSVLAFLILVGAAVLLYVYFPEGSLQKKSIIAGIILIVALIVILIGIASFEAMVELLEMEEKIDEIVEEEKKEINEIAPHDPLNHS